MRFSKRIKSGRAWSSVLCVVALAGGIWALAAPRVHWLGEIPSRAEITAENLWWTAKATASVPPGYAVSAAPVPPERVRAMLGEQAEWILSCETPTGTFALTPGGDLIVPYFANQTAVALLPDHPDKVKSHLMWYLEHLNRPDRWGLAGTVYDYRLEGGREVATGSYDSADAYAATFLTAVARYWQVTGDTDFVTRNRARLNMIADVIVTLQDKDGLAWAKPGHWVKYLMDNCENYEGLRDYASLLSRLGDREAAEFYRQRAEAVRTGIRERMYNPRRGEYYWAAKRSGSRWLPNWRQWYPDAVAQVFPVLCGVEEPGSSPARAVYRRFTASYPGWAAAPGPGRSPWGLLVPVAYAMGDMASLEAAMRLSLPARGMLWQAGEAAHLVRGVRSWLADQPSVAARP